ncbi:MAG: hypothetical protein AB7O59_06545, partial [Pirellulales bacterium]
KLLVGLYSQLVVSSDSHSLAGSGFYYGTIHQPVAADDVELFIVDCLTNDNPSELPSLAEFDFYVGEDDPSRPAYEQLLREEGRGRFREPICLVKLCHARAFQVNDRVWGDKCSKALARLHRQQKASTEFSLDWWTDEELGRKGKRLTDWLAPLGEGPAMTLARQFTRVVKAIILDFPKITKAEMPQAHDALLARFLSVDASGAGVKWYEQVSA